jgi:hypothetical protein
MENTMAQKIRDAAKMASGKQLPPEASDYNDDVSTETVKAIRADRGVDVKTSKWRVIDALGQVVSA